MLLLLLLPLVAGGEESCHLPASLTDSCSCQEQDTWLTCSNLTSTLELSTLTLRSVTRISILDSSIKCVSLADFAGFQNLRQLHVTRSKVKQALCQDKMRHKKEVGGLVQLELLDLSHNKLTANLHEFEGLDELRSLNLSYNLLERVPPIFTHLPQLTILDLSHNRLDENVEKSVFETIPTTIKYINLSGNPWSCSSSLAWLHPWSLTLTQSAREVLQEATCQLTNSHRLSPLLSVMETYYRNVIPQCPQLCSCHFYHYAFSQESNPVYTVLVNCSNTKLVDFPRVPLQTTILDLSNNRLSDQSYLELDVSKYNYKDVSGLDLSRNRFKSLDNKLLQLNLHRFLRVDYNRIREIPYDLSLVVQRYDVEVSLGYNPWTCSCAAEINNSNLKQKIRDIRAVFCGDDSQPESIVGANVEELDQVVLCPPSDEGAQRERVLQVLCVALALLILMVVSRLLYDYWHYRSRGTLPWIVLKMP